MQMPLSLAQRLALQGFLLQVQLALLQALVLVLVSV
jgi:hypothetical protein